MTKYPLTWPAGWKRSSANARKPGHFSQGGFRITITRAADRVYDELRRLGIAKDDIIVSSNLRVRKDGGIIADQKDPLDIGVAVYWKKPKDREHKVMATDLYKRVEDNLAAIAATLEAMRAIERHGGAVILERAFTGFLALPAPNDWRHVMGWDEYLSDANDLDAIGKRYRQLAQERHPDRGGTEAMMAELNWAWEQAQRELQP